MMATLAERRRQELGIKLEMLDGELKAWAGLTGVAPFRRHFSQVGRIDLMLQGLLESMTTSTDWRQSTDDVILAQAAAWERRILTAHAIWEVFRGKLAQRFDTQFQDRLAACDDLAWSCYEPAMKRFSTVKKEPPLVYLNSTWSAFLRRRDRPFEQDVEAGKDAREMLDDGTYRTTLKHLPVPLLGLPWFQVAHLPSALMVAHEVGHVVESDFDLTEAITGALKAANLRFEADWIACASEVFADLYGALCLGRGFADTLLDLLVTDREIVDQEDTFGVYPIRALRVELAVEALRYLELESDAVAVRDVWQRQYGSLQQSAAYHAAPARLDGYQADAKQVVAAIFGAGGMNLASLIRPPSGSDAAAVAQYAAQGNREDMAATVGAAGDARLCFCALRRAYDTYPEQQAALAGDLLVRQVVEKYAVVFRSQPPPAGRRADVERDLAAAAEADREAGRQLAALLRLGPDSDPDDADDQAGAGAP